MQEVFRAIGRLAQSHTTVLINGESGTGKELVARALHRHSPRAAGPFIALNTAAIPKDLLESELFGHERGAFTGAAAQRRGRFEQADGGTLFLDEIGELPLELQSKLLRVLENGEFQRVGETQSRTSNARVIAATNRDLRQEVRAGRFRADLYHRLSVFSVAVPPLRELSEDKLKLLQHYSVMYARQSGMQPFQLDPKSMDLWMQYGYPGNVRELRNIVIRLTTKYAGQSVNSEQLLAEFDWEEPATMQPGTAQTQDFRATMEAARKHLQAQKGFSLDDALRELEKSYVEAALDITHGNLSQAAKLLGIHRTTLYSRMQGYGAAGAEEQ